MEKITKAYVAVAVVGMTLMAGAGAAFADGPVDPTGGAADQVKSDASSWITTQGVPLIVALLVIGIVVSLLVKFARRGTRAA